MGFSFSKKLNVLPWLGVNLSTSGISLSAGPAGLKLNHKIFGKNKGRTRLTAGKYGIRYNKTL